MKEKTKNNIYMYIYTYIYIYYVKPNQPRYGRITIMEEKKKKEREQ